ncbi:hypothetical protein T265_12994, partial [Opisthorchis viverrini]
MRHMQAVSAESEQANGRIDTSLALASNNGDLELRNDTTESAQTVHSVLPWRQPNAEDVKTDCCTRAQVMCCTESKSNTTQTTSDETDTEPNLISWLTDSCMQSTTSNGQNHKLASVHCENEYIMHHRETTYAHHKHCLHLHLRQQPCSPPYGYSAAFSATENQKLAQSRLCSELPPSSSDAHINTPPDFGASHFRDLYPHHHHHYHYFHHHNSQRPLSLPREQISDAAVLPHTRTDRLVELPSMPGLLTQGKLKRFGDFHIQSRTETESEFEEALHSLKMRVWEWLNGVQDCA